MSKILPRDIRSLALRFVRGLVTNMDTVDIRQDFMMEGRGVRQFRDGFLIERDWGTHFRHATYPSGITIIDGALMYSAIAGTEYLIIVGLDASNNMRVFVYDDLERTAPTTYNVNGWVELTQIIRGDITDITGNVITIQTPVDVKDVAIASIAADRLLDFLVSTSDVNTKATPVTTNTASAGSPVTLTVTTLVSPASLGFHANTKAVLYRSSGILPDSFFGTDGARGYDFAQGATPHIRWQGVDAQSKMLMLYGNSSTVPTMRQPLQIKRGGHLSRKSFTIGGTLDSGWAYNTVGTVTPPVVAGEIHWITAALDGSTELVWAIYGTKVYKSSNGGSTWDAGTEPLGSTYGLIAICAGSKDNIIVCNVNGNIAKSTDGGANWGATRTTNNWTHTMSSVFAISANVYCATLWNGTYVQGDISTDTWDAEVLINALVGFNDIFAVGTLRVVSQVSGHLDGITGGRPQYYSEDSGATWSVCGYDGTLSHEWFHGQSVAAGQSAVYYAVMLNWPMTQTYVMKSTNGATWTTKFGWSDGFLGFNVRATGANTIRVIGHRAGKAVAKYSNDGGTNWTEEVIGDGTIVGIPLRQAYFLSDMSSGVMAGTNALVSKLTGSTGTKGDGPFTGWQINKMGLLPNFTKVGDANNYIATGTTKDDIELGEGIRLKIVTSAEATVGKKYYVRMYITALYAESTGKQVFQESDPICQIFAAAADGYFPKIKPTIKLDLGLVNKNLIGFNFYHAMNDVLTLPESQWIEDADEYIQAQEVLVSSSGWVFTSTNQFSHTIEVDKFAYTDVTGMGTFGQASLLEMLAHAPDTERVYVTPRYIAKASRTQGALLIIDKDNSTLQTTTYDGAGVHEDENFLDLDKDKNGNRQNINLIGRGELMGLSLSNDNAIAVRSGEAEVYDLQSGQSRVIGIDCVSKKSIMSLQTPHGLVWAGGSGVYFMPSDGSRVTCINRSWQNLYNGDMKLPATTTSYITASARQSILTGFDDFYQEVWFQILCNKVGGGTEYLQFRYSFQSGLWTVRQLNTTYGVRFFASKSNDKTFVIGIDTGVLKYPNQIGTLRFQDVCTVAQYDEPYTPVTASKGVPTKLVIHIGSLYGLDPNVVLWELLADALCEGDADGAWYMKLYGNKITTEFDSKTFLVGARSKPRKVKPRGQLEDLIIEMGLTSANETKVTTLDISTLWLHFISKQRIP